MLTKLLQNSKLTNGIPIKSEKLFEHRNICFTWYGVIPQFKVYFEHAEVAEMESP